MERLRAAFIAAERARNGQAAPEQEAGEAAPGETSATRSRPAGDGGPSSLAALMSKIQVNNDFTGKSFLMTFVLWLFFGMAGAHRFYLNRPISGAIQAVLFVACLILVVMQHYLAFAGLFVSGLWMVADAGLISRVSRQRG
jgi:TM2 domain-containing membrane protein YozV